VAAACGTDGSEGAARAEVRGETLTRESTGQAERAEGSGSLELRTDLPREARYGHLDIAVVEARVDADFPFGVSPDDVDDYVSLELEVTNRLQDDLASLPLDSFHLRAGGGLSAPGFGNDVGRVHGGETVLAIVWFAFSPGAELADPRLVIAESGYEPEILALTGPKATGPRRVDVRASRGSADNRAITAPGDWTAMVSFGTSWIDFDAADETALPTGGSDISPLGRAPIGFAYLHVEVTCTERDEGAETAFTLLGQPTSVGSIDISNHGASYHDPSIAIDTCGQVEDESVDASLSIRLPLDAAGTATMHFSVWESPAVSWSLSEMPSSQS
jgi:hypothetical protein